MDKQKIIVPKGIRYISEWKDYNFSMTPGRCIINKQVPGCGFTEYYLTNNENVIIASPRIMLLENKFEQHHKDGEIDRIFFMKNPHDNDPNIDKNIQRDVKRITKEIENLVSRTLEEEQEELRTSYNDYYNIIYSKLVDYMKQMDFLQLPYKILVTYDSYHVVKDILKFFGNFDKFTTMVDEVQVVLDDSRFKSNTELRFMNALDDVEKVHFVFATPMLDKYIKLLPKFEKLPYYVIDWITEDPCRVIRPGLNVYLMRSVNEAVKGVIQTYLDGKFEKAYVKYNDKVDSIVSDEAVFYVNSVNHIISIIKNNGLTPNQCNILCSNTIENKQRITRRLGKKFSIGKVPSRDEKPKMFTFCTRTVYLGADFYSRCARTFVFSDANSDCLSIDISIDLPQILGRQRLSENPWSNSANFYYRTTADYRKMKKEDFDKIIEHKKNETEKIIKSLEYITKDEYKLSMLDICQRDIGSTGYRYSYAAMNGFGLDRKIVVNEYALVSDIRAFDIQQIDYKDRFSVFRELNSNDKYDIASMSEVNNLLKDYYKVTILSERIKFICEVKCSEEVMRMFLNQLPNDDYAKQFYLALGKEKCKAFRYNTTDIRNYIKYQLSVSKTDLKELILSTFNVGDRLTKASIKEKLKDLYESLDYRATPKATDLEKWFELKSIKLLSSNGKWDAGFEILNLK